MKGRGTRTLGHDDLRKVTPSAACAKTHYVIVDAVGVTKSVKTDSQPLDTKPTVPLRDLAMGVMMGVRDEDTVSSLAGRLARLDRQLDDSERRRIREQAGGVELTSVIGNLLAAIDPDRINEKARKIEALPYDEEPRPASCEAAREQLVGEAANVFTGELIELIDSIRRDKEQTIDHDNLDTVLRAEWEGDARENAEALVRDFQQYLEGNRDEIEALTIFYGQPPPTPGVDLHDDPRRVRQTERGQAPLGALARLAGLCRDRRLLGTTTCQRAHGARGADPTGFAALMRRSPPIRKRSGAISRPGS